MVVALISSGLFLFTFESTQFNTLGFCLVLGASVLSGIRWTLSQCLTQRKDYGLSNPIDMIFHIQPWMFVTLLPLAIIVEGAYGQMMVLFSLGFCIEFASVGVFI